MIKRLLGPLSLLLMTASAPTLAAPIKLTFEEFAWGTNVAEYYNGGRDSHNRLGVNYGLSFDSTVRYTPGGAYLAGRTSMTISPDVIRSLLGTDAYVIKFNAGRYDVDGGPIMVLFEDGFSEPNVWISGNGNPYCTVSTPDYCNYPHRSQMGGYYVISYNSQSRATKIDFATDRLDNIEIVPFTGSASLARPATIVGSALLDTDIPEPAPVALFGIGLAGLSTLRRRKKTIGA